LSCLGTYLRLQPPKRTVDRRRVASQLHGSSAATTSRGSRRVQRLLLKRPLWTVMGVAAAVASDARSAVTRRWGRVSQPVEAPAASVARSPTLPLLPLLPRSTSSSGAVSACEVVDRLGLADGTSDVHGAVPQHSPPPSQRTPSTFPPQTTTRVCMDRLPPQLRDVGRPSSPRSPAASNERARNT